jgi:hypothetical protein
MNRSTWSGICASLAVAVALAGCGGSGNNTPQSRVRVVNALAGTNANIDVMSGSKVIAQNVSFGNINGAATTIDVGSPVPFTVNQTGTTSAIASTTGLTIQPNVDEVLLITGAAGTSGSTAPQVVALSPVDLSSTPTSSQARIYFVNASPGTTGATFSYSVGGGASQTNAALTDVNFTAMTPAQLPTIPNGSTVAFTASVNGGAETVTSAVLPAGTIKGGVTYLVVLTGRSAAAGANPALAFQVIPLNAT